MSKKKNGKWFKLVINHGWSTSFHLVDPKEKTVEQDVHLLDEDTYYDVKAPNGKEFRGCKIIITTHAHQGRGGMDESYSSSQAYFEANGFTIELKSGYLMRVNEAFTARQKEISRQRVITEKLKELYGIKESIDVQIAALLKEKDQ